jgi:translocation and assembly module TamA
MRFRRWLLCSTWLLARALQAADPQPYAVHIDATGNSALDALLKASSQLVSLRTSAPAGPFALVGRAEADIERLQTVLESYGYYRRRVSITINGRPLADPELPAALEAAARDDPARVEVGFELGPLFHLRRVTLEGEVSEPARRAFDLQSGAPAVASQVLAARDRLQDELQNEGHAFAKVDDPIAYEDAHDPVLDVSFKVDAGGAYQLGAIRFAGLRRVHEAFVRRRLLLQAGEPYNPGRIEAARIDLLSLGVFSGITVRPPRLADVQDGRVPITFDVQERKRHAVNLTAAYSSDLGGNGGATWTDRNLFGNAEQLSLGATITNWGGSDTTGLGYDLSAQLSKPDFLHRDQTLQLGVVALQQDLQAYDQRAITATTSLSRKLSPQWTLSVGVSVEQEKIVQQAVGLNYTLFSLPLTAKYDSTGLANPLLDPLHGIRATVSVAPTHSLGDGDALVMPQPGTVIREASATFIVTQATLATYFDLARLGWTKDGRSVVALRAIGADAYGAGQFSLPPDQRFYGGGSSTIRGYNYQAIGPEFIESLKPVVVYNGVPTGGTELLAGSAEFRQRIGADFGMGLFVDAGAVNTGTAPLRVLHCAPDFECGIGYGGGVRYYTTIGAIRLNIGLPAVRLPDSNSVEVYVGLGQAF